VGDGGEGFKRDPYVRELAMHGYPDCNCDDQSIHFFDRPVSANNKDSIYFLPDGHAAGGHYNEQTVIFLSTLTGLSFYIPSYPGRRIATESRESLLSV
jgi:hypothetical protein